MLAGLLDITTDTSLPAPHEASIIALQLPGYRCEALVRQGLEALQAARLDEAFLLLTQAYALQPERADITALLGHCLEKTAAHSAHFAFIQTCLNRFPSNPHLRQQFWRAGARALEQNALRDLIQSQLADIEDTAELNQVLGLLAQLPNGKGPIGVVRHHIVGNLLSGWAADLSDPARQLTLQLHAVRQGSRKPVDQHRTLLAELAIKGGQGPFQVALPQPFDALEVHIVGAPQATPLCGSPIAAVPIIAAPSHSKRDPASQPVCILIPVYKGFERTLACIDSVLAARPLNRTRHRIVVLDDASPDAELTRAIQTRARYGQLEYIRRPANLGFIRNMNRGMAAQPSSDVVWLNADTMVHGDWLDRLRTAAYSAKDVASATPWSNNGELMSFPLMRHAGPMPTAEQLAALDQAASHLSTGTLELELACGFCMYIKRRALEQVGYLDEVELKRGYGEESDWCLRARHMGWRHVAATRVFVAHAGGCSFGMEKALRVEQNNRVLRRRYPDAESRFDLFLARDPLAQLRRELQAALDQSATLTTEPSITADASHNSPLPRITPQQLPGRCWLIADTLDTPELGERWLGLARRLKRAGMPITLMLKQSTIWQPQLERAGVVSLPHIDGLDAAQVMALSGARLALSLNPTPGGLNDPRLALARQTGMPLFAPSASGLQTLGAYDTSLLQPHFYDSVLVS